jgi:hypothetical protein
LGVEVRVLSGAFVLSRAPKRTHPEPHSLAVEQFLAMLRFEQRGKLAELPDDLVGGRDVFF